MARLAVLVGGFRNDIYLRVIKPKVMINNKGREEVIKCEKWARHLWMPHKDKYEKCHIESIVELHKLKFNFKTRWNHCVSTIKWFLCKLTGIFLTEPKTLLLLQETKLHSSKVYLYLMFYFLPKKVISPSQQHNGGNTFFHDHHKFCICNNARDTFWIL